MNPNEVNPSSSPSFQFDPPWEIASDASSLQEEIEAILKPEHALFGAITKVLACRIDGDDVLLETKSGYALAHLSWCKRSGSNASFPQTRLFSSWQSFLEEVYEPDVLSWQEENPESEWEEQLRMASLSYE